MHLALTIAGMARLTQEHANNANSEMVFDEFLDFFTRIARLKAVAKARARRPSGVFNSIPAVKQFLDLDHSVTAARARQTATEHALELLVAEVLARAKRRVPGKL
jgi:hypothetical protein